jgi:hypothetical protein
MQVLNDLSWSSPRGGERLNRAEPTQRMVGNRLGFACLSLRLSGRWRASLDRTRRVTPRPQSPMPKRNLAWLALIAFVLTFVAARALVILIMSRRIPDLYLHVGGTHVHHLNYGIFLLAGVGAWLLFRHSAADSGRSERRMPAAAVLYGCGLALTFDEFGMWLHLGGSYWQRASFDAVIVAGACLSLIALLPAMRRFDRRRWAVTGLVFVVAAAFGFLLNWSLSAEASTTIHRLEQAEQQGPH